MMIRFIRFIHRRFDSFDSIQILITPQKAKTIISWFLLRGFQFFIHARNERSGPHHFVLQHFPREIPLKEEKSFCFFPWCTTKKPYAFITQALIRTLRRVQCPVRMHHTILLFLFVDTKAIWRVDIHIRR
jgi:hypothetical protein